MRAHVTASVLALVAAVSVAGASAGPAAASEGRDFTGTWATSPQVASAAGPSRAGLTDQTERAIVHVSVGGAEIRIRLSNAFGAAPVTFDEVDVAARAAGAGVVPGTTRRLRFDHRASVTVPIGRERFSDPVRFALKPGQDLAVSLFARAGTGPATFHSLGVATTYLSATGSGDHAADQSGAAFGTTIGSWLFVDGVDVASSSDAGAVVTFGDSITDGFGSTFDANHRWPDLLARRLLALPRSRQLGVLNEGISGNRLLLDSPIFGVKALDRLDRDVLAQSGADDVIVLLGINDIGQMPHQFDPNAITGALRQIADRSHEEGLRVFAGTLLPFKNTTIANYYTPQGDVTRQAVNQWIRTSHVFDGVIDFDRVMRSPSDPLMMNPAFDSGDHLHPNDTGYQAMANAVDLRVLRGERG